MRKLVFLYNKNMENINLATMMASVAILLGIFVLNLVVGMYYGFGVRHYWFFQTLHFLGGFFVAMFFSSFFSSVSLILISLGIISILWESAEFLIASAPTLSRYIKSKFRLKSVNYEWKDGLFDLALNFTGAILFLYLF
ncbi:MAG: hypothetical protein HYT61_01330 [Candidatus Yanofskybacteria bacterium]|nr:hypothetical protein [Candidatus Yanofskybacteria bacterium]